MPWIIGVDEAGYGPNLGPLVMTSVACLVPDALVGANLWDALGAAVRQGGADDGRILVDDSKRVHDPKGGLSGLERGVLSTLWREPRTAPTLLGDFLSAVCADSLDDLRGEAWYKGDTLLGTNSDPADLAGAGDRFHQTCAAVNMSRWEARGVIVPTPRFNTVADEADSKGAVLAQSLCRLIARNCALLNDTDAIAFFVDKHGGRNTYAAMIHHALPDGLVLAEQEGSLRSVYRVEGLKRGMRLTFQPRADSEHFGVALASMLAKYLRELLMAEFNRYWLGHVPGLKPTAGYPTDAARFMDAIRPAAKKLGLAEDAIWRKR